MTLNDTDVLMELEPVAEEPWSQGRDFDADPWTPDQPRLTGVARTAFLVNLLTEDNLPSYHREIYRLFDRSDSPWRTWVHRWTAE